MIYSRLSPTLKTGKKVHEVIFFDMQKYVYSESLFNTLYNEIKHICFLETKLRVQKMSYSSFFFFRELQLITGLLLIWDS